MREIEQGGEKDRECVRECESESERESESESENESESERVRAQVIVGEVEEREGDRDALHRGELAELS